MTNNILLIFRNPCLMPAAVGWATAQIIKVLLNLLHDYGAFAVSTIDRFFQQALKAFSREIGQFADYQIELDRKSLIREAMDRILDSLTEEDEEVIRWINANVSERLASMPSLPSTAQKTARTASTAWASSSSRRSTANWPSAAASTTSRLSASRGWLPYAASATG